jgi:hypothetical protein
MSSVLLQNIPRGCQYFPEQQALLVSDTCAISGCPVHLAMDHSRPTCGSWRVLNDLIYAKAVFVPVTNRKTGEEISYEKTAGTIRKIEDIFKDYLERYLDKKSELERTIKPLIEYERKSEDHKVCLVDAGTAILVGGGLALIIILALLIVLGVYLPTI